jgi:DhnA family fructose-bisphosphate aldolase class Ia
MTPRGATTPELVERLAHVRETRARLPEIIRNNWVSRHRRPLLRHDGRLLIVAADHPARGALGVRDEPMAMADRDDLLVRILTALSHPGVDGVLATADVLDDLLLMGELNDRVVIGSMNRGGLQGAAFELDDRFTGYDVDTIVNGHLDGGKMLCRIDLADPGTASTLESCGQAITGLAAHGLMAMIEPFWSTRRDGRVVNDLSTDSVIRSVVVASGLGARSQHTWLKLPVVDGLDRVMAATSLPALLLGGDPTGPPEETYEAWQRALAVPGVRGMVLGRAMLYPRDGDVLASVDAAARMVHATQGASAQDREGRAGA